jgi:hypothetical protein
MSWLHSILVAILTAAFAAVAGGFAANECVSWYRIPAREGESGYFIVIMILFSGALGLLAGMIGSRFAGGPGAAGFFTGLGITTGATLGLIATIALISWSLADIPPTINGHELDLVVEFRLPKGAPQPAVLAEKQFVWFESGPKAAPSRVRQWRPLDVSKAFQVDGRWVVRGSVPIFTTRGTRSVSIALDDKHEDGFELPLPGHPGPKYKQWSEWLPDAVADHWPETEMSYRFRVEESIPAQTPATPDPLDALTPASPLEEWLKYFEISGNNPARSEAILKQAAARPADLAKLFQSPDEVTFGHAMDVAYSLKTVDPLVLQGMRDVAADIENQIKKLASMNPQDAGYSELGQRTQHRFHLWCPAWEMVQSRSGVNGRPPVEEILKLASAHRGNLYMQGIVNDAQALLPKNP